MKTSKTLSTFRILAILGIVSVLFFAANALAASNTVPETSSGDGAAPITGYTVSNIHYTLSETDPTLISEVSFELTPDNGGLAPQTVRAQLVNGGTWFACNAQGGNAWSCSVSSTPVDDTDNLRIVAAQ